MTIRINPGLPPSTLQKVVRDSLPLKANSIFPKVQALVEREGREEREQVRQRRDKPRACVS